MSATGPATVPRTFADRIAELGFTVPLPSDWISHDLPTEVPDFGDGTALVPLAVVTAPHSALILAIAARPAYDDGTLHDWTRYLLQHAGLTPRSLGEHAVGSMPALIGEATQTSDMGPMVVRFAFCEDGRRLLNITLTAPEMLAGTVQALWFEILEKFTLTTPRGTTVPVMPGRAVGAVNIEVAAPELPEPVPQPEPKPAPASDQLPAGSPLQAPSEPQTFSMHALADDTATLDPEHRINANLRDRGIGLTPRILTVHPEDRRATIGAGALGSIIDVPFGWHVLDDGARTLLLEPSGAVQIHLELVPRDDRDNDTILDAIESGARDAYPSPRFHRHAERGLFGMAVLGIHDGSTELAQVHVLRQIRDDGMLIRARITAEPNRIIASTNLGELILNSARWGEPDADAEPTPTEPDLPEEAPTPKPEANRSENGLPRWYERAMELERDEDVKAAEQLLKDSIPHAAYAKEIASMHRGRMLRFAAAGNLKAARAARQEAVNWIYAYAGFATSGGEGAAFSWEADQFVANLPEV